MYLQAKTWNKRPSELLGIEDRYVAFCLDSAIAELGWYIEDELDKVQSKTEKGRKAAREAKLRALLSDKPQTKKFADPMDLLKPKS